MACSQSIRIDTCNWQRDQATLRGIRAEVFIGEQRVPVELEWDDLDDVATHFLIYLDDQPIGCARVIPGKFNHAAEHRAYIGRMAILKPYRNRGFGESLLKSLVDYCRHQGFAEIVLHAQCHAINFYQRLGFVPEGDIFMDAGIEHRTMRCTL